MTEPTGLDLHAAYAVLYPGLVEQGVRIQDLSDRNLQMVDRAARLRRAERERVKTAVEKLAERVEKGDMEFLSPHDLAAMIRKTLEEIR